MTDPNVDAAKAVQLADQAERIAHPQPDGARGAAQADHYEQRPNRSTFWATVARAISGGSP